MADPGDLVRIRGEWLKLTRTADAKSAHRLRILVAGTFTVDPVAPYLGTRLIELGFSTPDVAIGPYNQLIQLCLDWRSHAPEIPDAIVLCWRIEDFLRPEFEAHLRGEAQAQARALGKVDELLAAVRVLRSTFTKTLVLSNPPFPHGACNDVRMLFGHRTAGGFHRAIADRWAAGIDEIGGIDVLDLDGLQRYAGLQGTLDFRKWYLYRQPFTEAFWETIGASLAELIGRAVKPRMKCIILDCDNTLWGGIVGEDGLSGLHLGDDFPGSAYRDFQNLLLTLQASGVMLAICSKNNEQDVWQVFEKHDRMVLKRDHFVAHRIGWASKIESVRDLVQELNIGSDSILFVDDNPFEIAGVSSGVPGIHCFQVPSDPALLPSAFASLRVFDKAELTDEDLARSRMMAEERSRREFAASTTPGEFVRSLDLEVDAFPALPAHTARVSQLTMKTNQFNLTGRRRTPEEIAALLGDDQWLVLAFRARDRFGDYGLVGVAILGLSAGAAEIDTFLMSCRVLGRDLETSMLAAIGEAATARGVSELRGRHVSTGRNMPVAELLSTAGFEAAANGQWVIATADLPAWPRHVRRASAAEFDGGAGESRP